MKKLFISVFLVAIMATVANAQRLTIGGKVGANLNKISGKAFKDGYDLGYHVGGFAEIDITKKWGIQPEVLWNQVNMQRASGTDAVFNNWQNNTNDIKLSYLSIPILLRYNIGSFLTLNLGPQFGVLLSQNQTLWNNGKEAFKSGDFSLVGGASINVSKFRVYGRYNIGLNDIKDVQNSDTWKSQQLQFGLGIAL
jgi:hypothetical protein